MSLMDDVAFEGSARISEDADLRGFKSELFSCLLFSHSNSVCLNFLVMFVMPFSNYETNERPIFCWFNHVRISIRYTEPQFPHKALLKGW